MELRQALVRLNSWPVFRFAPTSLSMLNGYRCPYPLRILIPGKEVRRDEFRELQRADSWLSAEEG